MRSLLSCRDGVVTDTVPVVQEKWRLWPTTQSAVLEWRSRPRLEECGCWTGPCRTVWRLPPSHSTRTTSTSTRPAGDRRTTARPSTDPARWPGRPSTRESRTAGRERATSSSGLVETAAPGGCLFCPFFNWIASRQDSCSADGYTTSVYTLSISSATFDNHRPWYLEECPSTIASTYSSANINQPAIVIISVGNRK